MAKKQQIINPIIRFRQKAQGRYANRVGASTYARAISLDEEKCFQIVSAEIGDPGAQIVTVCFNAVPDLAACMAGWDFKTQARGSFTDQSSPQLFDTNCLQFFVDYTGEATDSAGPQDIVTLDYTPGACHKEGEAGNDDCLLDQYIDYPVRNNIWGFEFARVGDLADNIILVGFDVDIAVIGSGWRVRINSVIQTGWIPSIVSGNLQISLQNDVNPGDIVEISEVDSSAESVDGRFIWRFYDQPVENVVGAAFWMQESGDRWLLDGDVGRWQLE